MRRNGKTTRLINTTVDYLFKNHSVTIPTNQGIETNSFINAFIDPDYSEDNPAKTITKSGTKLQIKPFKTRLNLPTY